ncbi:sensor domain-containing diguanylate cyclase [candidate division FCPU426 bacterium]|nr:sensor domain-containing diguanylate cyclase [candidate division FCPU426 bacterium]
MNKRRRNYGILVAGYVLVACLLLLSQNPEVVGNFSLLFLPLVLLAGFLEGTSGALVFTLLSAVTIVAGFLMHWMPQHTAIAQIVSLGILLGFIPVYHHDRDARQRAHMMQREPKEKELLKVERKAFMIRRQIEGYEKRLKALTKLYEVAKKLSGILKLDNMLDEARLEVAQLLPHHFNISAEEDVRLAFYIPQEEEGDFQRIAASGHEISDEGFPDTFKTKDLQRWLGESFSSLRIKEIGSDPRFQSLRHMTPFRSLIVIPLVMHEIVIGIMALGSSQPGAFSPQDFKHVEVISKQIVFALRKALLYRKVQTLSFTDSLTGLYVHRFFRERLREEVHRAERYHQPLSMIMLDMDNFKRVNDKHGHQVGDAVLAESAARIQEMSGGTALVARYGGEEFAVLLPNTAKARASQVAQAINTFVKATPMDVGGTQISLTISAGVSMYPDDAHSQEALIASADAALYQAKREGRDRVVIFEPGQ